MPCRALVQFSILFLIFVYLSWSLCECARIGRVSDWFDWRKNTTERTIRTVIEHERNIETRGIIISRTERQNIENKSNRVERGSFMSDIWFTRRTVGTFLLRIFIPRHCIHTLSLLREKPKKRISFRMCNSMHLQLIKRNPKDEAAMPTLNKFLQEFAALTII